MLTAEQSQQSSSQLLILDAQCFYFAYSITNYFLTQKLDETLKKEMSEDDNSNQ